MPQPRRFAPGASEGRSAAEVDPGPVQIQPRRVHFDFAGIPLHWIPGHPVASDLIGVLNVILPAAERWFVATLGEALPLVKDPKLAEDIRGFIGQEAIHADVHERALREFMVARGVDPGPMLDQVEYVFSRVLGPSTSTDPRRRHNRLCDRLWFIAALEHYTAVLGDFALNNSWDDYGAHPTFVDVFRWHGAEEVEHRNVAHDVATYFSDSYADRLGAMVIAATLILVAFQRFAWYLVKTDPEVDFGWWTMQRLRYLDSKKGLLPRFGKLFGTNTLAYLRPGFSPEEMGSTAQAVAYLASSPAARAAHL
ncbi:metal-dependent hydrolase [Mycobacterium sp.]|uniref:metal-dependent hydrolase n=1 Tax=Mycobacterium sp. TaxID=1785 RepID=UPI002B9AE4F7|nr:metal-dependent hydrolase [Mycobacterium sp.]HME49813.1 metal-dependent hydrolase [Mycobacterium sp.]